MCIYVYRNIGARTSTDTKEMEMTKPYGWQRHWLHHLHLTDNKFSSTYASTITNPA